MDNYYDAVRQKLESYEDLGVKILDDGTKLIANAFHIAPQAWLHKIFKPLNEFELLGLEKELNKKIPYSYRTFLSQYGNGLKIFVDVFSLNGLRKVQGRGLEAAYQPYSLITRNTKERLHDATSDIFFIGNYSWDGSLLYIRDEKVYRCTRTSVTPLNEWSSFDKMLLAEVNRICKLYDKKGKQINQNIPITPQNDHS